MKVAENLGFFTGKEVAIKCTDRMEWDWTGMTCRAFDEKGILFDYESRGANHVVFIPMRYIGSVQFREGAPATVGDATKESPKEAIKAKA